MEGDFEVAGLVFLQINERLCDEIHGFFSRIVQQVIVVTNEDCGNLEFPESEIVGQTFLNSIGLNGTWKQTSYNSNFRKNYAGIGNVFDESRDAFIGVKPFPSWVLNPQKCLWEAPIPYPGGELGDGQPYRWIEAEGIWKTLAELNITPPGPKAWE